MSAQTYIITNDRSKQQAAEAVARLRDDGHWQVDIRPHKAKRSLAQNKCFHAWMAELSKKYAEHYGEERAPWAWKEFMKRQFLGEDSSDVLGEIVTRTRRTRDLNVSEFADFLTRIEVWVLNGTGISLSRNQYYAEAFGL